MVGHPLGLVRLARDHAVADLELGNVASDAPDDSEVAVAHPAGVGRRAGHVLRALVVAAVGANLEARDDGLAPDVVGTEVLGVEGPVFDREVARTSQDSDLHVVSSV